MINNYRFLICVSLRKRRLGATAKIPLSVCHQHNNEKQKIRIYFFRGKIWKLRISRVRIKAIWKFNLISLRYEYISLLSFFQLDSQIVEHLTWNPIILLTSLPPNDLHQPTEVFPARRGSYREKLSLRNIMRKTFSTVAMRPYSNTPKIRFVVFSGDVHSIIPCILFAVCRRQIRRWRRYFAMNFWYRIIFPQRYNLMNFHA